MAPTSSRPVGGGQPKRHHDQHPGLLKSSLDIVWSYSRSQAYYGSALPSSPSFVQRYRRPEDQDEEDEDEEDGSLERGQDDDERRRSSRRKSARKQQKRKGRSNPAGDAGAAGNGDMITRTPTDGSTEGDDEEDDDEESYDSEDEDGPELDGLREPLPWNAQHGGSNGSSPARGRRSSTSKKRRKSSGVSSKKDGGIMRAHLQMSRAAQTKTSPNSLGLTDTSSVDQPPNSEDPTYFDASHRPRSSLSRSPPAQSLPILNERTPLLEKLPRTSNITSESGGGGHEDGALGQPQPDERIYSSSPPESVPFPRRSPHIKKRRPLAGGNGMQKRRSSHSLGKHVGSSTSGQTLFNAINVLVGIGILAQPLAFSQAGWLLGVTLIIFCSALTNYTAKILARVLREDHRLMTYADIGAKAFGQPARTFINLLFCLEISALCVALLILLADSLSIIFPTWPLFAFKLLGFAVIFPTLFLPLRYLSIASLIGIMSVVTLTLTVLIDGTINHTQPGSLHHPMPTTLGPAWGQLPIAFGLIMSGYGGHAVVPNLARDMRKPEEFDRVINLAFLVATAFYLFMGVVGYIMFGNIVSDEITRDLLKAPGLPRKLNLVAVCMVAITPLCKYSLSSTPLESTVQYLLGLERNVSAIDLKSGSSIKANDSSGTYTRIRSGSSYDEDLNASTPRARLSDVNPLSANSSSLFSSVSHSLSAAKPTTRSFLRLIIKVATSLAILLIAIFIPSFDRVMGLLGAFSVFLICAIGPISANIVLHRRSMSYAHIAVDVILLVISIGMAAVGTVWVFLPKQEKAI